MIHVDKLKALGACEEAITFASKFNTFQEAWDACNRSDWMLWIIENKSWFTDNELRLFAVRCARDVQHLMKDKRSITAIDVAENYANGQATNYELDAARAAARDAAMAAWAAARAATRAARDAAMAAWAAVWDASRAARAAAWASMDAAMAAALDAAWAAMDAAEDAEWSAALDAALDAAKAKQCGYIRKILPNPNF